MSFFGMKVNEDGTVVFEQKGKDPIVLNKKITGSLGVPTTDLVFNLARDLFIHNKDMRLNPSTCIKNAEAFIKTWRSGDESQ